MINIKENAKRDPKYGPLQSIVLNSAEEMIELSKKDTDYKKVLSKKINQNKKWRFGDFDVKQSVKDIKNGDCPFDFGELKIKTVPNAGMRRRKRYTDMGGELDVTRALGGSVTPFSRKTRVSAFQRSKSFYISFDIHSGVSAEDIHKYVKKCIEVIQKSVSEGYMVDVFIADGFEKMFMHKNKWTDWVVAIKLKDKREKLDIKRIGSIAYPAFYRFFIINIIHITNMKSISNGYGSTMDKITLEKSNEHLGYNSEKDHLLMYQDYVSGRL